MHSSPREASGPVRSKADPEKAWRFYLSGLASYLESRIARAVQAAELGLNDDGHRPKCSFLFLGPTGVGKTESAKCFTEYIFGGRAALEMVFMNEYSSDARLPDFLA